MVALSLHFVAAPNRRCSLSDSRHREVFEKGQSPSSLSVPILKPVGSRTTFSKQ
jgi:hypothetical protein